MQTTFWLKVHKSGKATLTKSEPFTNQSEIATQFSLEVPDAIFAKPKLKVNAKLGEDYKLPEIRTEVVSDIENYVKEKTGLDLEVKVIPLDDETNAG